MLPAKPFSYPGIHGDIERLSKLLAIGLQTATWHPPDSPAILNLACGRADESGILLRHLAPAAKRLFYLGIDLRAPEINEARARWIPTAPLGWDLDFRVGDAARTDRMKQLPSFDFIFIRHQNFWHDIPTWTDLYANALDVLKPTGLLARPYSKSHSGRVIFEFLVEAGGLQRVPRACGRCAAPFTGKNGPAP